MEGWGSERGSRSGKLRKVRFTLRYGVALALEAGR